LKNVFPRLSLPIVGFLALANGANADCYDVFGCSDSNYFRAAELMRGPNCEFLWTMRNAIYKQHGYCFRTQRGIEAFGNAGCRFDDVNAVPLNNFERANVATIKLVEASHNCPR
jgi:hypothetical protein